MHYGFVQVARMLIAVDSGRLHEFKGKNLSSIDINGKQLI